LSQQAASVKLQESKSKTPEVSKIFAEFWKIILVIERQMARS
jgi:hypothetical protein